MDPFERRTLGSTDVQITRLGLGTAPLGGWPTAVPHDVGVATARRAWDLGIRYFDTAPYYGQGTSELMLGDVLREHDRSTFTLSTKVGRRLDPGASPTSIYEGGRPFTAVFDYSGRAVRDSLDGSRERLGLDRPDIAYIHDPEDAHAEALADAYPVLADLRADGVLRAVGVSMNHAAPLAAFAREADFDCLMLAGRYTLLQHDALDDLMPAALETTTSIVAGGVLNSGVLADPAPGATFDYVRAPHDVLARAQELAAVCREHDVPLRAAALQFPLAHPAVAGILVGARTPEEIDDAVAMLQVPVPVELWEALRSGGLVREDAPVPT